MKRIFAAILLLVFAVLPAGATVSSETNRVKYTCNGVLTTYAYTFKILEDDDLLAVKALTATGAETTLVLNTDYTVTGAGGAGGGNLVLTAGSTCASGYTLTLLRNVELTQDTDYVDGDAFSAESLESALDKITLIQQQQDEKIGRAALLRKSSAYSNLTFPDPEGSKYIGWNSGATALENKSFTQTTVGATNVKYLSNYADFAAAVAAIGSTATTLVVDTTANVSVNTTTPASLQIRCEKIGSFVISTGVTLTIYGSFSAGRYQCFTCSGTGKVVLPSATLFPEWWGALGDGATDDSLAFYQMNLSVSGGAVFDFGAGKTYLVTNTTYAATAYSGVNNLKFKGNKATLKIKSGTGPSDAYGLYFVNCSDVDIEDLSLDGNRANIALPGAGDGQGYGIWIAQGNNRIHMRRINAYDWSTDAVLIGNSSVVADRPDHISIEASRLYRSRRNNISITGASNVRISGDNKILSAGVTVGGSTGTAPKAGIDLEADIADATHTNDIIWVEGNYFQGNVTTAIITAGTSITYNLNISKNRILVDSGDGVRLGGSIAGFVNINNNIIEVTSAGSEGIAATTPATITDVKIIGNQITSAANAASVDFQDTGKARITIESNTFKSDHAMLNFTPSGGAVGDYFVQGNTYISTGDNADLAANDPVVTINDAIINDETFVRASSLTDAYRYRIGTDSVGSNIKVVGTKAIIYDLGAGYALPASLIDKQANGILEFYGTAAPVSGTWVAGAIVRNTAPAAGGAGVVSWFCTTGGSPGTWTSLILN